MELYTRNVLSEDLFDSINKKIIFYEDNEYYQHIRNHIDVFKKKTLLNVKNKTILEIGPPINLNERIISNDNEIETCDIVKNNNTTYVCDLTKDNNIPNEKYDIIYCLEVLEHTFEPWEMINQLYLKLKKNGILHISVPLNFRLHGPIPDAYRISEYGLVYLLKKYKFEIIEFESLNDKKRPAFPIHYNITCKKI